VNRLLELVAELTGHSPDPIHAPAREGDIKRSEAEVSAARSVIGYEPRFGIEEGLRRTVDWFSSNGMG
jgi:nucleoside-diphosphate-sugar epimerase